MRKRRNKAVAPKPDESQVSELLILPDGRILVHNLTRSFAALLHELNPDAGQIASRLSRRNAMKAEITRHSSARHEPPI